MMSWLIPLIIVFGIYEAVVCWAYKWVVRNAPEQVLWIQMGSKVLKLLIAIAALAAVHFLTDIPLKAFAIAMIVVYLVTLVIEVIFFLKNKK